MSSFNEISKQIQFVCINQNRVGVILTAFDIIDGVLPGVYTVPLIALSFHWHVIKLKTILRFAQLPIIRKNGVAKDMEEAISVWKVHVLIMVWLVVITHIFKMVKNWKLLIITSKKVSYHKQYKNRSSLYQYSNMNYYNGSSLYMFYHRSVEHKHDQRETHNYHFQLKIVQIIIRNYPENQPRGLYPHPLFCSSLKL